MSSTLQKQPLQRSKEITTGGRCDRGLVFRARSLWSGLDSACRVMEYSLLLDSELTSSSWVQGLSGALWGASTDVSSFSVSRTGQWLRLFSFGCRIWKKGNWSDANLCFQTLSPVHISWFSSTSTVLKSPHTRTFKAKINYIHRNLTMRKQGKN